MEVLLPISVYRNRFARKTELKFKSTPNDLQVNCLVQTTEWSVCSKTCGMGISTRVTNDNPQCQLEKESRLCFVRFCNVSLDRSIKVSWQLSEVGAKYQIPTSARGWEQSWWGPEMMETSWIEDVKNLLSLVGWIELIFVEVANIFDCALQGGAYIWELDGFLGPGGEMAEYGGVGLMGEGVAVASW